VKSVLILKGEDVYKANEEKWEKDHSGKILAIDIKSKDLGGAGDTLDEAYSNACRRCLRKRFYFRKVGPHGTTSYIPWFDSLLSPCREYGRRVVKVTITGQKGKKEYEAYADTRAEKSVIAEDEAIDLDLLHVGDTVIFTGGANSHMKLFRAIVDFLGEKSTILVLGAVLPKHAAIKVILGNDVLI